MKKENKKYAEIAFYCLLCLIAGVIIIFILMGARDFFINKEYTGIYKILQPFIMGAVMAYLLNPLMSFLENKVFTKVARKRKDGTKNKKIIRTLSLLSTFLLTIILVALLLVMVIPQIMASINQLTTIVADLFSPVGSQTVRTESPVGEAEDEGLFDIGAIDGELNKIEIDKYMISNTKIGVMINEFSYKLQDFIDGMGIDVNVEETFNDLVLVFTNNIVTFSQTIIQPLINQTASILYSTATGVVNMLLAIVVSIYLLHSRETYQAQIKKTLFAVLPVNFTNKLIEKARQAHEIIGGFIVGNILDSLIVGIICFIFMTILGMNYPMLISVIIAVTNLIPFFGPFIGAIPSIFFLLFADPIQALWFTIFILVLQQIDGNIIIPKVLSSTIGLSSFWVIFAILVMNGFFGLFGMFFGVPIFAVIYISFKEFVENRLKRKNLPHDTVEYLHAEEGGAPPDIKDPPVESQDNSGSAVWRLIDKTDGKIKDFLSRRLKGRHSDDKDENNDNES